MKSPAVIQLESALVAALIPGIEAACAARASVLVTAALGRLEPRAVHAPTPLQFGGKLTPLTPATFTVTRIRRKAPIQLCPAPRCTNRAAPAFGMLCASHRGTPVLLVREWRARRRARKGR